MLLLTFWFQRRPASSEAGSEQQRQLERMIGLEGRSLTTMCMTGYALIGGTEVEVISRSLIIRKGSRVRVVGVKMCLLVVEEIR